MRSGSSTTKASRKRASGSRPSSSRAWARARLTMAGAPRLTDAPRAVETSSCPGEGPLDGAEVGRRERDVQSGGVLLDVARLAGLGDGEESRAPRENAEGDLAGRPAEPPGERDEGAAREPAAGEGRVAHDGHALASAVGQDVPLDGPVPEV